MKLIIKILVVVILMISVIFLSGCINEEKQIISEIEKANYCSAREDCVEVSSKCPFGCIVYVNEKESQRINELILNFKEKCVYDCMAFSGVNCINGKCVIQSEDSIPERPSGD